MTSARKLALTASIVVSVLLVATFSQLSFLSNTGASEINPPAEQIKSDTQEEILPEEVISPEPIVEPEPEPEPDLVPPVITDALIDGFVAHKANIQVTAEDAVSPISAISYSIVQNDVVVIEGPVSTVIDGVFNSTLVVKASTTVNTSLLTSGLYKVRVCASDAEGNVGTGFMGALPTQDPTYCYEYNMVVDNIDPVLNITADPTKVVLYKDSTISTSKLTYSVSDNNKATAVWLFILDSKVDPQFIRVVRNIQDSEGNFNLLADGQYNFTWDGKGCLWNEYLSNKYSCDPSHPFSAGQASYYGIAVDEATLNSGWIEPSQLTALGTIEVVQEYINPLKVDIKAQPGTAVYEGTKINLTADVSGYEGEIEYRWTGDCTGNTKSIVFNKQNGLYKCFVEVRNGDNVAKDTIDLKVFPYAQPKDNDEDKIPVVYTGDIPVTKGKTDMPDYDFQKELERIRKEREERERKEREEREKEQDQKDRDGNGDGEDKGEQDNGDTNVVITDGDDDGFDYNLIWICLIPLFLLSLISFAIMSLSWFLSRPTGEEA